MREAETALAEAEPAPWTKARLQDLIVNIQHYIHCRHNGFMPTLSDEFGQHLAVLENLAAGLNAMGLVPAPAPPDRRASSVPTPIKALGWLAEEAGALLATALAGFDRLLLKGAPEIVAKLVEQLNSYRDSWNAALAGSSTLPFCLCVVYVC